MMLPHQLKLAIALPCFRRCILVVLVAVVLRSAPSCRGATCSCSDERDDVIKYRFPSFNRSSPILGWNFDVLGDALRLNPTWANFSSGNFRWGLNASYDCGFAILPQRISLWLARPGSSLREASFNTTFTITMNDGSFMFLIQKHFRLDGFSNSSLSPLPATTSVLSDIPVAVEVGTRSDISYVNQSLYVSFRSATNSTATYTVWIDYNAIRHNLSVYIIEIGKPKPEQPKAHAPLNISGTIPGVSQGDLLFGFFAWKPWTNQSLTARDVMIHSWNVTADTLAGPAARNKPTLIVILTSVLGSVAATAALVSMTTYYIASRFKVLEKELKLSEALRRLPGTPREFKYAKLKKATRNFHKTMMLGKGGFGAVYKGIISSRDREDGRRRHVEVAVKKFTRKEDRGYDDFLAEVDIINRLRHKNIVPLVGWSYEKGELLLVYEYMPNGSLDQHLFRESLQQNDLLGWNSRYNIIRDVAAGLHYVHHEYERVVLHRDIKASNIMLDSEFHGRLGDFGLARIIAIEKNSFTDLDVAGTRGFIAPEYSVCHKATRQTDVYAFGVLIHEIVTSRQALSSDPKFPLLTDWVWRLHREGRLRLVEAVDSELISRDDQFDDDEAYRLLLLGLACCNPNPSDRPTMADVVQVLAKSAAPPEVPILKPTFIWPPEGGLPMLSDVETSDDEESCWELGISSSDDGLAVTIYNTANTN